MQLGIRGKLVGTLMLAGLLPLVFSLVAGVWAVHEARERFVGQSFRAMAIQQARHLATLVSAEIDFLTVASHLPGTLELLEQANAQPPLTPEQIRRIEEDWTGLPMRDALLRQILDNPVSIRWRSIQAQHPRIAEVLITDRTGRLVAATNKTSDYFQADEAWWQWCVSDGRGRTLVADIAYDESAVSRSGQIGVWVVDVVVPIRAARASGQADQLAGVAKVSLDADWLLEQLQEAPRGGKDDISREIWLIGADGKPAARQGAELPFDRLPGPVIATLRERSEGYLITRLLPRHGVIGFSRVKFPGHQIQGAPRDWHVIVTAPHAEAMAPTRFTTWIVFGVGSLVIVLSFAAGLLISQREVIRPLLMLEQGAKQLEQGNLDYRLAGPDQRGSCFRRDEIGRLANDFNRMADQLSRTLRDLAEANRVKQQFIDLASHELRTPVTYILGVTTLALRQNRCDEAMLARVAAKAQRLNRIVESMFKLLQSGSFQVSLNVSEVDLPRLISAIAAEMEPFVEARRQRLTLRCAEVGIITVDAEKLRDMIHNLLSNAIRFSPDDSEIQLEVRDRGSEIEIIVADSGPGINAEDLPHIFEPFYRGQAALSLHSSGEFEYMTHGIGLGLGVVRRFAEMHGGTVQARSTPQGARFHIFLPKQPRTGA